MMGPIAAGCFAVAARDWRGTFLAVRQALLWQGVGPPGETTEDAANAASQAAAGRLPARAAPRGVIGAAAGAGSPLTRWPPPSVGRGPGYRAAASPNRGWDAALPFRRDGTLSPTARPGTARAAGRAGARRSG